METLLENKVMNHTKRSSEKRNKTPSSSLHSHWKLKYQDFLAKHHNDKSESFQKLVDKANDWLKKNPEVAVKSCETITWMSSDLEQVKGGDQMVLSKKLVEGAMTVYCRGLRLWLIPRRSESLQSLYFEDYLPSQGDKISHLVDKINKKFQHKHLAGKILSMETIGAPILKGKVRHILTSWQEGVEDDAPYTFVIRIFVNKNTVGKIGKVNMFLTIKDIIPLPWNEGYEGFEVLAEKANSWLKDQKDELLVTNMQSVMVQKDEGETSLELGQSCHYSMPGISNIEPVEFFRILRIYLFKIVPSKKKLAEKKDPKKSSLGEEHLNEEDEKKKHLIELKDEDDSEKKATSNDSPPENHHFPTCFPFVYETFTPEIIREKDENEAVEANTRVNERLEMMRETFSKVIAFLRNTGADVLSAETVTNPMQLFSEDGCDELEDEMKFLFTIRLYLTGQIGPLMNGGSRIIKRLSSCTNLTDATLPDSDKRQSHSSPLFLRSVVSRQFKYRWAILAISAFSCMTIIVVVSVIYSNHLF